MQRQSDAEVVLRQWRAWVPKALLALVALASLPALIMAMVNAVESDRMGPLIYVLILREAALTALAVGSAAGLSAAHFSFNIPSGRCERCQGAGGLPVEMHFLPDVLGRCPL